jgi:hypothetical protein
LITSIALADVVADALGITRESAQLHLKTIRAAGEITFKGYGRAAAAMTPLDASRLLIAIAGSTFAKDSADVLKRFAMLRPLRTRSAGDTLEQFLAVRIAELPMEIPPADYVRQQVPSGRPFGSRRLAETALQLFEPIGSGRDNLPCFAVVRWLSFKGHSNVLLFGASESRRGPQREDSDDQEARTGIVDLIERYANHRFFQVRVVRRTALIDVAAALKGLKPPYGNAYGNTR